MPVRSSLEQVRQYWESHPLYSYELSADASERSFFEEVDRIKREEVERFSRRYWQFDLYQGRKVLDIGCGPGWLAVQYASGGAQVTAVDLTETAVQNTKRHLAIRGLEGRVLQANAEALPFDDGSFDLVYASGVLHHTPDTEQAVREAGRVTKPGGAAKITLYHKGLLHAPVVFPVTRWAMRRMKVRHPGADLAEESKTVDDFIRRYDGQENPVGRGYSTREACDLFRGCGFEVTGKELHFFPVRFLPRKLARYRWIHYLLDRYLGTMIYATLAKADIAVKVRCLPPAESA